MSLPQTFNLIYPQPFTEFLVGLKFPALDFTVASTGVACFAETNFYFHVITGIISSPASDDSSSKFQSLMELALVVP